MKSSLLIGAGGTGVRVLRFIQTMADEDPDGKLATMMRTKRLRMVAIDTDSKSNERDEDLDEHMAPMFEQGDFQVETAPKVLRPIKETWIQLDRRAINQAVPMLSQSAETWLYPENDDFPLRCARQWFPQKTDGGDQITLGHSKLSGAAQWRPLGRLALFLDASRVYNALHRAISDLETNKNGKGIDVYIVCSLAGGTGSGLFWDLAFFIQMISSELSTHGMFLMGDPFEGVDEAGRIFPNVYAALKEIYYFKNWTKDIKVTYPIGEGKEFDPKKKPSLPFDTVYLFQSFPAGLKVANRDRATIDYTCFRMAHNLIAHMRLDIHEILDVGANNVDSDASAMASQSKRGYCFSTSSCMSFPVQSFDGLKRPVMNHIFQWVIDGVLKEPEIKGELLELDYTPDIPELGLGNEMMLPIGSRISNIQKQLELFKQDVKKIGIESVKKFVEQEENKELVLILTESKEKKVILPGSWDAPELKYKEKIDNVFNDYGEKFDAWKERVATNSKAALSESRRIASNLKPKNVPSYNGSEEIDLENIGLQPVFSKLLESKKNPWYVRLILGESFMNKVKVGIVERYLEQFFLALEKYLEDVKATKYLRDIAIYWNQKLDELNKKMMSGIEEGDKVLEKRKHVFEVRGKARRGFEKRLGVKADMPKFNALTKLMIDPGDKIGWRQDLVEKFTKRLIKKLADKNIDVNVQFYRELSKNFDDILFGINLLIKQTGQNHMTQKVLVENVLVKLINIPDFTEEGHEGHLADLVEITVECFLDLFSGLNDLFSSIDANGEFERLLWHAKPNIFRSGIRENPINKRHLVSICYSRKLSDDDYESRRYKINILTQKVFRVEPVISPEITKRPIIYFEDLFRSADEITKIHDYYDAYSSNPEHKRFYHIHPDIADYPEILELPSQKTVFCGNPGCTVNINLHDRGMLFCQHCQGPIWNRCGNERCREDNLYERIRTLRENPEPGCEHGEHYVPRDCPSCHQELRTYWWKCGDARHSRWNPMDKHSCVTCVEEFQQGSRRGDDIHRRPDKQGLVCHGCQEQGGCSTFVPDNLLKYYREGVNGHETQVFRDALERVNKGRRQPMAAHECKGGTEHHMLFPTCSGGEHHHLYFNEKKRWTCTRHPDLEFYGCGHCGYPMQGESVSPTCPRCKKQLEHCDFCSPTTRKFHLPIPVTHPKRCSHCGNLMCLSSLDQGSYSFSQGLTIPAFCPNLFGCRAARDPKRIETEYHQESCRSCEKAGLIPSKFLDDLICRCPLCSLILDPEGKVTKLNPDAMAPIWKEYKQKRCRICGTIQEEILHWASSSKPSDALMKRIEPFSTAEPEPQPRAYVTVGFEFNVGISILRGFHQTSDDREVMAGLLSDFGLGTFDRDGFSRVLSLFFPGAHLFQVLEGRVKGLLAVLSPDFTK